MLIQDLPVLTHRNSLDRSLKIENNEILPDVFRILYLRMYPMSLNEMVPLMVQYANMEELMTKLKQCPFPSFLAKHQFVVEIVPTINMTIKTTSLNGSLRFCFELGGCMASSGFFRGEIQYRMVCEVVETLLLTFLKKTRATPEMVHSFLAQEPGVEARFGEVM